MLRNPIQLFDGWINNSLDDLCAAALARPAEQPAIEYEGRWYRWGEFWQLAQSLTVALDTSGAPPEAPFAFVPRNHPASIAALMALIAARRSVRMVYAFQSPTALAREVERLAPAALIASAADFEEPVRQVLGQRGMAAFALDGMDAAALPGFVQCREPASARMTPPRIEILTSGTTGTPKQFAISYELIMRHIIGTVQDLSGLPPTLLFFPLGNISGLYSTLPALLKGQRAVLLERFSVKGWHDYILRHQPEASGLPPAGIQMVLDADIPVADLACLRRLGTGAAPLDPTVQRAFETRYGVPILLSYGATEFGGPVTAMTLDLHASWGQKKFGSVGRALPGAQLRVVDPDSGAPLPHGSEGLLEVISPRIGPDWIRTSDIAVIDEDGFLFHRGRSDGAIMRGGFKLLPETIERALMTHPAVSAAAVTGVADARLGQVPGAAIEFKPGLQETVVTLEAHLRQQLPATHIPVHWRFVSTLPRTLSLKVERPALRRLFE